MEIRTKNLFLSNLLWIPASRAQTCSLRTLQCASCVDRASQVCNSHFKRCHAETHIYVMRTPTQLFECKICSLSTDTAKHTDTQITPLLLMLKMWPKRWASWNVVLKLRRCELDGSQLGRKPSRIKITDSHEYLCVIRVWLQLSEHRSTKYNHQRYLWQKVTTRRKWSTPHCWTIWSDFIPNLLVCILNAASPFTAGFGFNIEYKRLLVHNAISKWEQQSQRSRFQAPPAISRVPQMSNKQLNFRFIKKKMPCLFVSQSPDLFLPEKLNGLAQSRPLTRRSASSRNSSKWSSTKVKMSCVTRSRRSRSGTEKR